MTSTELVTVGDKRKREISPVENSDAPQHLRVSTGANVKTQFPLKIQTHHDLALLNLLKNEVPIVVLCWLIIDYTKPSCGTIIETYQFSSWAESSLIHPLGIALFGSLGVRNLPTDVEWRVDLQQFASPSLTTVGSRGVLMDCASELHVYACQHELHFSQGSAPSHICDQLSCGSDLWFRQPSMRLRIVSRIKLSNTAILITDKNVFRIQRLGPRHLLSPLEDTDTIKPNDTLPWITSAVWFGDFLIWATREKICALSISATQYSLRRYPLSIDRRYPLSIELNSTTWRTFLFPVNGTLMLCSNDRQSSHTSINIVSLFGLERARGLDRTIENAVPLNDRLDQKSSAPTRNNDCNMQEHVIKSDDANRRLFLGDTALHIAGMYIEGIVTNIHEFTIRARCGNLDFGILREDWPECWKIVARKPTTDHFMKNLAIVIPIPTHHTYAMIAIGAHIRAYVLQSHDDKPFIYRASFLGLIDDPIGESSI